MIDSSWSDANLPPHLRRTVPHTVEVSVVQVRPVRTSAGMAIPLDAAPTVHSVRLERDGVPLSRTDIKGWSRGEADGWRPIVLAEEPGGAGVVIDIEAEELREDG